MVGRTRWTSRPRTGELAGSRWCLIAEGSDRVRTGSGALSDHMDVLARTRSQSDLQRSHLDWPWPGRITWQPKEHNYST